MFDNEFWQDSKEILLIGNIGIPIYKVFNKEIKPMIKKSFQNNNCEVVYNKSLKLHIVTKDNSPIIAYV